MSGLTAALSLLTRVPAGRGAPGDDDRAAAVAWFPVVGALVGLVVGGAYAAGVLVLPPLVAGAAAVGLGALLTGGLHEDGLADTADALGSGADRDAALRILHDPRLGTFGVLALSLVVLIRVGALAALTGPVALVVVPAAHALSRGAVVVVMAVTRPATEEGLGASYAGRRPARRAVAGAAAAILVGGAGLGWWVMPAVVLAGVASTAVAVPAVRRLGGVTGDVLGAVQQVAEATVLVLGAAALAGGVWWR